MSMVNQKKKTAHQYADLELFTFHLRVERLRDTQHLTSLTPGGAVINLGLGLTTDKPDQICLTNTEVNSNSTVH